MLKAEKNGVADRWSRLVKTGTLLAEVVNRRRSWLQLWDMFHCICNHDMWRSCRLSQDCHGHGTKPYSLCDKNNLNLSPIPPSYCASKLVRPKWISAGLNGSATGPYYPVLYKCECRSTFLSTLVVCCYACRVPFAWRRPSLNFEPLAHVQHRGVYCA